MIAPTCVVLYNLGSKYPDSGVELKIAGGQDGYTGMAHRGAVRGVVL